LRSSLDFVGLYVAWLVMRESIHDLLAALLKAFGIANASVQGVWGAELELSWGKSDWKMSLWVEFAEKEKER